MKTMDWDEIEPIIRKFYVWQDQPEKPWFQKAWKSLHQAGLATYDTDIDRHWVRIPVPSASVRVVSPPDAKFEVSARDSSTFPSGW